MKEGYKVKVKDIPLLLNIKEIIRKDTILQGIEIYLSYLDEIIENKDKIYTVSNIYSDVAFQLKEYDKDENNIFPMSAFESVDDESEFETDFEDE